MLTKVSIFDYVDYRLFLKEWFEAAKSTRASMSYRKLSQLAGLKSTNFILLIIQGKGNLSEETGLKIAQALKLNKHETEFFRNLILFNQAEDPETKDRHYRQLLKSRKFQALKPLAADQYEYCSTWYHAAIRELVSSPDFDGSPEWLSRRLFPKVSAAEARASLALLEKLGLIHRAEDGRLKQASALLSTGAEVFSVALFHYHLNMLDLTGKALHELPAEERDVSALTLGVKKSRLPELKKMIQHFRQEVLKSVAEDESAEEVLQVNIQMFPLTQRARRAERKNL